VDADVHARERDERGNDEERLGSQRRQPGQDGGAGEARRRVTGGERRVAGCADERLGIRVRSGRPVALEEPAQDLGGRFRKEIGDEHEREDLRPPPEDRRGGTQDEPEEAHAPQLGERDERLVQAFAPMQDDPPLQPVVES
jgi:hypothetical protein